MIPMKVIRSLTNDHRAQRIGDAIGVTNEKAGIQYLEMAGRRILIERQAVIAANQIKMPTPEDRWVVDENIKYFKQKKRKH